MLEVTRCGYVAIVGRPNVGKSTLLNHVLGQKISITSRKPQTTRRNLIGVDTQHQNQAIYVDTPGIHQQTERELNRYMVSNATSALADVDLLVVLIEGGKTTPADEHVLNLVAAHEVPKFAVLSKVDLIKDKTALLPQIQALGERSLFDEIVPLSALKEDGVERFREHVFDRLPLGPHFFADDEVTDQPELFLVAEIVREKLMRQLGDEIPHSATVVVEHFKHGDKVIDIHADIVVERDGQKRIVIGKQGSRLKLIGQESRKDIELMLDHQVMLHLWVKVRKGWTNSALHMRNLGYD
ncbi:GTPase Era [Gammaproteobacteria bacterium]|nr:GTPase Era [Gammaproteobacteria bacterium]